MNKGESITHQTWTFGKLQDMSMTKTFVGSKQKEQQLAVKKMRPSASHFETTSLNSPLLDHTIANKVPHFACYG